MSNKSLRDLLEVYAKGRAGKKELAIQATYGIALGLISIAVTAAINSPVVFDTHAALIMSKAFVPEYWKFGLTAVMLCVASTRISKAIFRELVAWLAFLVGLFPVLAIFHASLPKDSGLSTLLLSFGAFTYGSVCLLLGVWSSDTDTGAIGRT